VSKLQIIGLSSLILSYTLITIYIFGDVEALETLNLFYIAWVLGIISVISNILLADKFRLKGWQIGIFGFCGILWFFPFFMITFFGIPCMFIFLVIGVYIHIKAFAIEKQNKKTA
jgi:hypothetical protein